MKKITTTFVLLLTLFSMLMIVQEIEVVEAEPKTIVVPDEYASIQDAIDVADEGDIVFVRSGLYYQTAIINKSLSLVGENRETTIIDGNGTTTRIYVERDYVTVTGFTIRNVLVTTQAGIILLGADYCNISNNILINNRNGIRIEYSSYNMVARNIMMENGGGISINGFNNSIYGNEIVNCNTGIGISYGANNTISENNLVNNSANGFNVYSTKNNYIIGNNVTNSGEYGIIFTASNGNSFFRNNFNNNNQTFDNSVLLTYLTLSVNIWDNGFEGNYWSDYNGTDADGNGIGDTLYLIYGSNQDNYPLMAPIYAFDASTWEWTQYNVYVVSNSTVSDFSFNPDEGALLRFDVEGEDGTTGFCRVTIPKDLLNAEGNWTVLVDGNSVTPTVNEDTDNSYLYFTYNHYTKQTVEIIGTTAIPEFPSWTILPLFMVITLLTVTFYKRLLKKAGKT